MKHILDTTVSREVSSSIWKKKELRSSFHTMSQDRRSFQLTVCCIFAQTLSIKWSHQSCATRILWGQENGSKLSIDLFLSRTNSALNDESRCVSINLYK